MRRLALLAAASLLSACFIEPTDGSPRRLSGADRTVYGSDLPAVEETDAFLTAELARGDRAEPARLDLTAKAVGLRDGAELAAVVGGDCLARRDLARFARARFARARRLGPASAGTYLRRRFGVRVCPDAL